MKELDTSSLFAQPISLCILGLLLAILMSHVARFALEDAAASGWAFAKIVLYYLLFIGLTSTPRRLRLVLLWLAAFVFVHAVVALLQFHRMINVPYFSPLPDAVGVDQFGHDTVIDRLVGSGIFHNPNEFCYPVGMAVMICLYFMMGRQSPFLRILCLAALPVFGYAMTLTHSRGGFIGLLIGVMCYLCARFGWRKAVPVAAFLLPILFVLFAGRQTNLDTSSGTGQQRIQLWNDGLVKFVSAPIFGLGTGLFKEEIGLVCHNSFLQAYSELGFFGGSVFTGAFYYALWMLFRLGRYQSKIIDPEMARLRPYLAGLVGGFMGCMLTMSVVDMIPTYTILGLVTVYLRVTALRPPVPPLPQVGFGLVLRMIGASALTLLVFRLYVWQTFIPG
jgi:O-antigen ligase